ncbi:MAG: hypothetical protein WBV94_03840 [Blastocatellia bacterium]
MFCPKCGTNQSDELKFCKSCGGNLAAVRQAVTTREASEKPDWGKSWSLFLDDQERRKKERERRINPEEKRYNEIKAGVITSCVGVGLMLFLYLFMQGIISGGNIPFEAAQILSRIWIAGVLPLFVGAGLLINGVFVGRKLVEIRKRELQEAETTTKLAATRDSNDELSPSADWYEPGSAKPSVTEHTTRQLENSRQME